MKMNKYELSSILALACTSFMISACGTLSPDSTSLANQNITGSQPGAAGPSGPINGVWEVSQLLCDGRDYFASYQGKEEHQFAFDNDVGDFTVELLSAKPTRYNHDLVVTYGTGTVTITVKDIDATKGGKAIPSPQNPFLSSGTFNYTLTGTTLVINRIGDSACTRRSLPASSVVTLKKIPN